MRQRQIVCGRRTARQFDGPRRQPTAAVNDDVECHDAYPHGGCELANERYYRRRIWSFHYTRHLYGVAEQHDR